MLENILFKNIRDFSSAELKELQLLLNNCGYNLVVDGIFGPKTNSAFEGFKRGHNLIEPEFFGPTTYKALSRYDNTYLPAMELIKEFEGLVLSSYVCPAGVMTIGYGTTVYEDGSKVLRGQRITTARAEALLLWYIKSRIIPRLSVIPGWGEMGNHKQSALISFAYNVGEHFYGGKGFASITKVLKNKDWGNVPKTLMLYVNPGSSFEKGLRRRRQKEGTLWSF